MTGDVTEGVGNEDHGTHDDSFGVSDDIGARGSEADTEGSDILSKDVVTKQKSTAVTRLILDDNTDQTGEHVRHEDVESGVGDLSSDDSAREGEDNLHGSLGETHKDGLERGVSV